MLRKIFTTTMIAAVASGAAFAQVEQTASEEEAQSVRDSIARIGCEAGEIEKESENLYEIDDAPCEIGQYDIKLNGDFTIISMTYDGAAEDNVGEDADDRQDAAVSQEVKDRVTVMLADMQCEMDTDNIEADDAGYELDDVFCADGQYDIELDENLGVTNRRKE